jgi:hypothetical protein
VEIDVHYGRGNVNTKELIQQILATADLRLSMRSILSDVLVTHPPAIGIHLAIFSEPFLTYVLDGKKTVDSRFSIKRTPPYGSVREDDILLLKEASGPIVGVCQIGSVWNYELDTQTLQNVRYEFADALCAVDPHFWESRSSASFATLMRLHSVQRIAAISIAKRDRRGWVVLRRRNRQYELWRE